MIEWVEIPAGTFLMGTSGNEGHVWRPEGPKHSVELSSYKMSKYEVTFQQYDAFCEATGRPKPSDNGWGRGNRPVVNVNWYDAMAFAKWMGCRLPTEAEWEYACRAGSITAFNLGTTLNSSHANFNGIFDRTKPVGSYVPNAWNLHDMHGNVWEWCSDWYSDYSSDYQIDPYGLDTGTFRVVRGGSWYNNSGLCRSGVRGMRDPTKGTRYLGFRVVSLE